ncbi:IS66 family insertion sequence element accessory protein TnpA [Paenibacillus oceani]
MANEHLRQQWVTRIAEYRASGLTLKAWCAAHDLRLTK